MFDVLRWPGGSLEFPKLPFSRTHFNCCFCRQSKQAWLSFYRVQTDLEKPGKPGKTGFFEKSQESSGGKIFEGKAREKSRENYL